MTTPVLQHPVLEHAETLAAKVEYFRALELEEVARVGQLSQQARTTWTPVELQGFTPKVDYSPFIPYIREQGGYSCGMQAGAACWDILNEKATSFSPNVSANRMIWLWKIIDIDKQPLIAQDCKIYNSVTDYEMALGVPTEGSELTNTDAVQWPTEDGNIESPNFRLAGPPIALPVEVNEIKKALNQGPVRVSTWRDVCNGGTAVGGADHFVALVGYDDSTRRFKFVNSWGDQWNEGGFGYFGYDSLNKEVEGAEQYHVVTPKSLAVAHISFTHSCRQDVFLWLGIEGYPSAKRIWPTGQLQDVSHNLSFTVTLPRGFVWPPGPDNRLYLDIYDCGRHYESGGQLQAFWAAFCYQVVPSAQLENGPVNFQPHTLTHVFLP